MRVLVAAIALASFALGFATGRGDGNAYAGVAAAALATVLFCGMAAASGFVWIVWRDRGDPKAAEIAAEKAAHVEQEV